MEDKVDLEKLQARLMLVRGDLAQVAKLALMLVLMLELMLEASVQDFLFPKEVEDTLEVQVQVPLEVVQQTQTCKHKNSRETV